MTCSHQTVAQHDARGSGKYNSHMPPVHDILELIVLAAGVARFTSLFVFDDILEPVRHCIFKWSPPFDAPALGRVYQTHDFESGSQHAQPRSAGFVGRLVSCYHCTAVWVAAAAVTAVMLEPAIAYTVLTVAAASQIAELLIKTTRED